MFSPLCDGSYLRSLAHLGRITVLQISCISRTLYYFFTIFFKNQIKSKALHHLDRGPLLRRRSRGLDCQLGKETLVRMIIIFLFSITRIAYLDHVKLIS